MAKTLYILVVKTPSGGIQLCYLDPNESGVQESYTHDYEEILALKSKMESEQYDGYEYIIKPISFDVTIDGSKIL